MTKHRIMNDLAEFHKDPPPGIFIESDENNLVNHIALIIGPDDTPYEGGFFFFEIRFPNDYPFQPPKVEIRTSDPTGKMRFNPNLYINGKVCLSILGTWQGPKWTSVQNLSSCLLAIRSLMNDMPLENEPGYEKVAKKQKLAYNEAVTQLVLQEAVIRQLSGSLPNVKMHSRSSLNFNIFLPEMRKHFRLNYSKYLRKVALMGRTKIHIRIDAHEHRPNPDKICKDLEKLGQRLGIESAPFPSPSGINSPTATAPTPTPTSIAISSSISSTACVPTQVTVVRPRLRLRPLPKLHRKLSLQSFSATLGHSENTSFIPL